MKRLKSEAKSIMEDNDSLIIFKSKDERWLTKEIVGDERNKIDNFL
ncbi:hypothetical protein C900_00647 [Fulvivirga imtechensis AK7]|uniref:Uncharacterized protein n=1 Tax=Fulvivirga imtechensis AK7 TaxID=1237149 RepID=L8K0F3_9BACT|nr:hypothetical protein C900_00647 [Fulvivirga imtechensis AK7]